MKIILRFTTTDSWHSKLIRWFTNSEYSHVEIQYKHNIFFSADIAKGVAQYETPENITKEAYYTVDVKHDQYSGFMRELHNQLGKKYDYLGLLGFVIDRKWDATDKWFCSELVAFLFNEIGIDVTKCDCNRVTPQDLLESPYLHKMKADRD